jgi:diaminobutyrate-2-oxoglutarate transaminase
VSTTDPEFGAKVSRAAFERGLVIETAGAYDEVVKFLPALTIDDADLLRGVDIVEESVETALAASVAG